MHLQRVVDDKGDFLDLVVQHRRHTKAASKAEPGLRTISQLSRTCSRLTAWRDVAQPTHQPSLS